MQHEMAYIQEDLTELIGILTKIDTTEKMQRLFEELFTQKEKYDFALRWRLMKDLYDGKPQRDIAADLKISLCKITRGSKILKQEDSCMLELIKEKEQ